MQYTQKPTIFLWPTVRVHFSEISYDRFSEKHVLRILVDVRFSEKTHVVDFGRRPIFGKTHFVNFDQIIFQHFFCRQIFFCQQIFCQQIFFGNNFFINNFFCQYVFMYHLIFSVRFFCKVVVVTWVLARQGCLLFHFFAGCSPTKK